MPNPIRKSIINNTGIKRSKLLKVEELVVLLELNEIINTPARTEKKARYSNFNNFSLKWNIAKKTITRIPTLVSGAISERGAIETAIKNRMNPDEVIPVPKSHFLHPKKDVIVFLMSFADIAGKLVTSAFWSANPRFNMIVPVKAMIIASIKDKYTSLVF